MAIRWDKLTIKAQEAIQAAGEVASEHGNPEIMPMHLLVALSADQEGVVAPVLAKLGASIENLRTEALSQISRLPKISGQSAQPTLSQQLSKVLDQAFKEADLFKDEYVSTEHLLLAIAQSKGDPAEKLLSGQGANHGAILKALTGVRGSQRVTDQNPE